MNDTRKHLENIPSYFTQKTSRET